MHNRCGCPSRLHSFPSSHWSFTKIERKHQSWQIHSGPMRLFQWGRKCSFFQGNAEKKKSWLTNKRASVYRVGFGQGNLLPHRGRFGALWSPFHRSPRLSLRSMLPFSSLNGGGHFKIGKLCVENSAWLPAASLVLVFQNWLLLTVFS